MGQVKILLPSKLVIGLIYPSLSAAKDRALVFLGKKFGEIDYISQKLVFDYTDYYYPEFGQPLERMFVSFKKLIFEDSLADIKLYTNKLEKRLSRAGKRQVNIDPGFLNQAKLILATTKDQKHRIYLGKGIFAEVTLFFRDGTFCGWDWTYPDYKTKSYLEIFNFLRTLYLRQLEPLRKKHDLSKI